MLTYSFDQATFACPHFSTNQVEMITQETNPVYWACTHCLTLEPWTVIISTFILVQFDNTIRFATLESVRPGLTAKGSFKNSKSKGRNLFINHLCEIFHFIVKCVAGKCNNGKCSSPSFFPLLYALAMLFCFFSKFRFIRKNTGCRADYGLSL